MSFHKAVCHINVIFGGGNVVEFLKHFFFYQVICFLLSFKNFLYILGNSPLPYVYFQIVSLSQWLVFFILLAVSFIEEKCLKSSLWVIISLMDYAFGVVSKE